MDRREFTKSLAAAGLAIARPGALTTANKRLDRIGLQLYTVRDLAKLDLEATLAHVAEIGYKEVEFAGLGVPDAGYFGKSPAEVKQMLARHGLSAPSAHVDFKAIDPGPWSKVLADAKEVGHEYVIVAWIPPERRKTLDDFKQFADRFNRMATEANAAGLQFAYHNHDFEFTPMNGQLPYDVLVQNTDSKLVQLEIDLFWITKSGQDPLKYFARWPGRIPLVHVKDSAGPPANDIVSVGMGTIHWRRIFARSQQAGIKHYFVENDNPADPMASITTSYRYLKNLKF